MRSRKRHGLLASDTVASFDRDGDGENADTNDDDDGDDAGEESVDNRLLRSWLRWKWGVDHLYQTENVYADPDGYNLHQF